MSLLQNAAVFLVMNILTLSLLMAEDEEIVDFGEHVTAICEVTGLTASPPAGWFNVPIESEDEAFTGCQMMRAGDEQELVGILRLASVELPETGEAPWYAIMIAIEQQNILEMGYVLGEVLWSRESVPISGEGFENARAVGLSASVEGSDIAQEVHFLVFEHEIQKFAITLLTPAQDVDEGIYYKRNTDDFGILIRSLKRKSGNRVAPTDD